MSSTFEVNGNEIKFVNPVDVTKYSSVIATEKHHDRSDRYKFISSSDIVGVLEDYGWHPAKVHQTRTRVEDKQGYQKHTIRFRQLNGESLILRETIFPEIVLVNSHDGLSAIKFIAGLWRQICSNGLVTSENTLTYSYRHKGSIESFIGETLRDMVTKLPTMAQKIKTFDAIDLTPDEKGIYAAAAASVKYDAEELEAKHKSINPISLLLPTRKEDAGNSLWKTFNVVQEKLTKGGKFLTRENKRGHVVRGKAKGITNISEDLRVNRALWALTEQMATLKGAGQPVALIT